MGIHALDLASAFKKAPKLTPEQKKEVGDAIKGFMQSKGFKSPSDLARALKKDKKLEEEFASTIGSKLNSLGLSADEKTSLAVGKGALRGLIADERKKLKLLNLVGGNEAFLKNAEDARTLLAEVKAEVGEKNTIKFLMKYHTDAGFRSRVNALVSEKLKDERFAAFSGLSAEEVVKGASAVQLMTASRWEKLKEVAPIAVKEGTKSTVLTLGSATVDVMDRMTTMMVAAVVSQVPGGAYLMSSANQASNAARSAFSALSSGLQQPANSGQLMQNQLQDAVQLIKKQD